MKNKAAKISAGALAVSMLGAATFPLVAANAADETDDSRISNYESVSAQLSSTGEPQSAVIVDQLTILGNGEVAVANPVAGGDQRNLSGFGAMNNQDGVVTKTVNVDGSTELRALADFEGDMPVSLSAKYFLNGEEISPDELTRATGDLRVEYTVTNETGDLETISFTDAAGNTVTKEVMIYTPLAGSFSTVLPDSFSNVASPEGAVAADGRGGTKMQWSLTLLPPLSGTSATFGYTADVVNGSVPEANLSIIPVKPMSNPTAANAVASYESGSQSGSDLYAGGVKLEDGLTQLADGAGQLLAGLAALHNGAGQLSDGLGTANAGAQQLSGGAAQVNDGATQLADGSGRLADGLKKLEDGINTLEDKQAFQQIIAGLQKISAGVGDPGSMAVDADGVPTDLNSALNHIRGGLAQMKSETAASQQSLKPLVDAAGPASAGAKSLQELVANADKVTVTLKNGATVEVPVAQLAGLADFTAGASAALPQIDAGMSRSIAGYDQLGAGLAKVQTNVNGIGDGADALTAAVQTVYAALAGDMANGVRDLSAGADQLSAGANALAAGTGQLADGSASLAAGTDQLATGANTLADGLGQANGKAPAMADGIDRLSSEGAAAIKQSGMDTQLKYEEYVAQIAAAAERTKDGALPAGAPDGAIVATAAYSFDVAGTQGNAVDLGKLALIAAGLFAGAGVGVAIRERKNS